MIKTSQRSLVALALVALACGGSTDSDTAGGGKTCVHGGTTYQVGDSFQNDCNTCQCTESGVACTEMACTSGGCVYAGQTHPPGQSFPASDGCNTCSCDADGTVSCTLVDCAPTCMYGGVAYAVGESFPAMDGCNTCTCTSPTAVSCTTAPCDPAICTYAGKTYAAGGTFPSLDGCNTCVCASDGTISCTELSCPCNPAAEWWRDYISTDPEDCKAIKYACPEHTTGFGNACGCGCEQDVACPQWFDCMPPAQCDADLLKKCPYSGVAY